MPTVVYLNGQKVDYEDARISIEDRGFLFGDGLYEVVHVYKGRFFHLDRHLARLEQGAKEIYLNLDFGLNNLANICRKAAKESGYDDASVYIQVTRGAAVRQHAFPDNVKCTWLVIARECKGNPPEFYENGIECITVPDERWGRCNIKTVQLLANCIAKEKAKRAGSFEAIFHKGGAVREGSSSNVFIVKDNKLMTHPADNRILNGITRGVVLEMAERKQIEYVEEVFTLDDLFSADEVFLTGTTTEIMPVVKVDGKLIGDGVPGTMTRLIQEEYQKYIDTVDC
ncbi:MAG: D-amino-acid transaminase [Tepidanaerobacteraceae bacterium]|jgi:D-alanine transaminase|nr:D-amino-acid transaminase [Tepidanaerobacter sp.]HQA60662.1 D-amino-acid transaminase [Tepidanaerobacteraceae bacterium]